VYKKMLVLFLLFQSFFVDLSLILQRN
jgi:hypothetical protein